MLRAGVVHTPADRVHEQRLWPERDGEILCPAAVGQQLYVSRHTWQKVGEDHRTIITAQEQPLPSAQGQVGEVLLVTAAAIGPQPTEEEDQEPFVCKEVAD